MEKASTTIDMSTKIPASYLTKIDNNGIFIHKVANNNPTPTTSSANGIKIADSVEIIKSGVSVAEYGSSARIGKNNAGHLQITDSNVTVYGNLNEPALSFGSSNNMGNGVAIIEECLKVDVWTGEEWTHNGAYTSFKVSQVISCYKYKNDENETAVTVSVINEEDMQNSFVYNDSSLSENDFIKIRYQTLQQISYLNIGENDINGGNCLSIGYLNSSGPRALTVGSSCQALGKNSAAFGEANQNLSERSFSSGLNNVVKGENSSAFGTNNTITTTGHSSFTAGAENIVKGDSSTAFGVSTRAYGPCSFVCGNGTYTSADAFGAFACGEGTSALGPSSFVCGQYNARSSNNLFAIGKGTADDDRSNALVIDYNGNMNVAGTIKQNGTAVSLSGHNHSAADITSGTLPIARGGTGMTGLTSISTTTSSTISTYITAGSGFSVTTFQLTYWGKVAMVRIVFKKNSTAISSNTNMTLGTLKQGYRPKYNAMGQSGWTRNAIIQTDGTVHVYGTVGANEEIGVYSTFILA